MKPENIKNSSQNDIENKITLEEEIPQQTILQAQSTIQNEIQEQVQMTSSLIKNNLQEETISNEVLDEQTNTDVTEDNKEIETIQQDNNDNYLDENFEKITEIKEETPKKLKSIAIFYGQESSNEKIKNITKYRELISNSKDKQIAINDFISLINEINTQANTNVSELKGLFDQLQKYENKINFITNSQSANLIELFANNDITYSLFNPDSDKKVNILSLFGLTNAFKCTQCSKEYLDTNNSINSYIIQCPKCKSAMLPNLFTANGFINEINIDYYNQAITTLAKCETWLLIHPLLNEKLTFNMLKSAFEVSNNVKEIYILDKDINIRETYKNMFLNINENIKVNIQMNVIEEFFNSIN